MLAHLKRKCPPNQDIEKHWAQKFVEFLYRGGRYCYGQVELLYGQLGLSSSSPSVAFPASLNLTSIQQNLYLSGRFLSYPSSSALASALLFWSLRFPWEFSNQSTRAFGTTFCTFIARGIFAISKKKHILWMIFIKRVIVCFLYDNDWKPKELDSGRKMKK